MSEDLATLREKVERYRRLMASVADKRAADVLFKLITEINAQIGEAEGQTTTATQNQQEQPKPESDG